MLIFYPELLILYVTWFANRHPSIHLHTDVHPSICRQSACHLPPSQEFRPQEEIVHFSLLLSVSVTLPWLNFNQGNTLIYVLHLFHYTCFYPLVLIFYPELLTYPLRDLVCKQTSIHPSAYRCTPIHLHTDVHPSICRQSACHLPPPQEFRPQEEIVHFSLLLSVSVTLPWLNFNQGNTLIYVLHLFHYTCFYPLVLIFYPELLTYPLRDLVCKQTSIHPLHTDVHPSICTPTYTHPSADSQLATYPNTRRARPQNVVAFIWPS